MKLAPMTTARFAPSTRGDDARAVGERAQVVHVRQVGAGHVKRTGSAPVASSSAP